MRVLEVTLTLTLDPTPTHPNPSPNLSSNPNPHPNVGPLQVSDTSERGPLGASEHLHVLIEQLLPPPVRYRLVWHDKGAGSLTRALTLGLTLTLTLQP